MRRLRAVKTDSELAILQCANELTKAAIRLVATSYLREGVTEDAVKEELYRALETGGLRDTWALVLFAENAAYPHGTENRIQLRGGAWRAHPPPSTEAARLTARACRPYGAD
jgi:Xaa-Pro aminopeptidase